MNKELIKLAVMCKLSDLQAADFKPLMGQLGGSMATNLLHLATRSAAANLGASHAGGETGVTPTIVGNVTGSIGSNLGRLAGIGLMYKHYKPAVNAALAGEAADVVRHFPKFRNTWPVAALGLAGGLLGSYLGGRFSATPKNTATIPPPQNEQLNQTSPH